MRVALVSSSVPFVNGGFRNIVDWLVPHLERAGHEVEVIWLPFTDDPAILYPQLSAFRTIDLTGAADVVICFRPPAYLIRHPRKVLWFIHHLRFFYDLWDSEYSFWPDTAITRSWRDGVRTMDDRAFAECSRIFTNSAVMSDRLQRFNGVDGEVLFPPIADPERFRDAGQSDTVVYVSRVEPHKRQELLVEALGLTATPVRVLLAGTGSSAAYPDRLRARAAELGVGDRLSVDDRWISEEEKADMLSTALAVAYLPHDEDSYGYPSLEAAHSGKPIITTTDSGGVLEFVDDSVGWVTEPDPVALAAALDAAYLDRAGTAARGAAARARIDELGITWDTVVARLLS